MSRAEQNARCLGRRCVSRYPEAECSKDRGCSLLSVLLVMSKNPDRGCMMPEGDGPPTGNRYTNRLNALGLCTEDRPTRITPDGRMKAEELRK